jgi:hypothetical protein
MKKVLGSIVTVAVLVGLPVAAQSPSPTQTSANVVSTSDLRKAVVDQKKTDAENAVLIQRVLNRSEVADVAARLGMNVGKMQASAAAMSSEELARVAVPARAIENTRAGGTQAVYISVTTLLLLVILLILIVN